MAAEHHSNCADWTYETHPERATVLVSRCQRLVDVIWRRPQSFDRFGHDTRAAHRFMFLEMTPQACSCILGTYRGDATCAAIASSYVGVGADPRVGTPPFMVAADMVTLEKRCAALIAVHQKWLMGPGASQSPQNALLRFVQVLAPILELFLTIHPYKDGNGHAARLLIYVMMVRGGYRPKNWDVDSKQPYGQALSDHRNGKPGALQKFLLKAIF